MCVCFIITFLSVKSVPAQNLRKAFGEESRKTCLWCHRLGEIRTDIWPFKCLSQNELLFMYIVLYYWPLSSDVIFCTTNSLLLLMFVLLRNIGLRIDVIGWDISRFWIHIKPFFILFKRGKQKLETITIYTERGARLHY